MDRPELFDRSVNVLVRAFFDGTLAAGTCAACAVGNLFAAAKGARLVPVQRGTLFAAIAPDGSELPYQIEDWMLRSWGAGPHINRDEPTATGYTLGEIARIGHAFELATEIKAPRYRSASPDEIVADQFRGLLAVVDALQAIHGADEPAAEAARVRFRAHPALVGA